MEPSNLSHPPLSGTSEDGPALISNEDLKKMMSGRIKNFLRLALDQGLFDNNAKAKSSMGAMLGSDKEDDIDIMVMGFFKYYDVIGPKKDFQDVINKWTRFWAKECCVDASKLGTEETETMIFKKCTTWVEENEKDLTYLCQEFATMFQALIPLEDVVSFVKRLREKNPDLVLKFIRYCELFNTVYEGDEEIEENGKDEE